MDENGRYLSFSTIDANYDQHGILGLGNTSNPVRYCQLEIRQRAHVKTFFFFFFFQISPERTSWKQQTLVLLEIPTNSVHWNALGLFHDSLGVQSTNLCVLLLTRAIVHSVWTCLRWISSSGYFVFKNNNNKKKVNNNSANDERSYIHGKSTRTSLAALVRNGCIVYNDGSSVSKLTVPTHSRIVLVERI